MLQQLLQDERGATAIEYGLIVALISLLMVGALMQLGTDLSDVFTTATSGMSGGV